MKLRTRIDQKQQGDGQGVGDNQAIRPPAEASTEAEQRQRQNEARYS